MTKIVEEKYEIEEMMWYVAQSWIQNLESKDCKEKDKTFKILPERFWEEEKLEITKTIWDVEVGGSGLDLKLSKAKSWVHCLDINDRWGVASYKDELETEHDTLFATVTLCLVQKLREK